MHNWNEIRERAVLFSKEWQGTYSEEADAKPFLDAFFNVFGITRKKIGTFEYRVKKLNDTDGYIDLLWKQTILIEMKSLGKDLDKAFAQAKAYLQNLPQHELPKYIMVCDFNQFKLHDLENDQKYEFTLKDLNKNVQLFGYLLGYTKPKLKEQDPANIKAAELMGKLHDRLEEIGYKGHALEVYLVRLLFCLFAEDSSIFNRQQFQDYIEQRTNADGSDLASRLTELFQILNTDYVDRFSNLDEQLAEFPYVNGKLFNEILPTASFDSKMRQALLNCCYMDWSKISPAIFGSMFQSVMNPVERRNLGAHYTSEKNILKLIKPLFLDELWAEFEKVKYSDNQLKKFHVKISKLRFLDPACGCGNFLITAYKELRLLELDVVRVLLKGKTLLNVADYLLLDVDKFYGIEYEEFPAQIAQVAMWLIDHQMNNIASEEFGQSYSRLPLKKSATIVHGNALRMDWQSLLKRKPIDIIAESTTMIVSEPEPEYYRINVQTKNLTIIDNRTNKLEPIDVGESFDYIMGNPPFVGKNFQSLEQKEDIKIVYGNNVGYGNVDYVTSWFVKTAKFISNNSCLAAFVSTNSITQGEQVGLLWPLIFKEYKCKIFFAHRTFKWHNESKGNAAVHCIIVGFANNFTRDKFIYTEEEGQEVKNKVGNINAYLIEGNDLALVAKTYQLCGYPKMINGSKVVDGGHLLLSEAEQKELIETCPESKKYIKQFIGSDEYINNIKKYCLWFKDVNLSEVRKIPILLNKINLVKKMRESSIDLNTQKHAQTPYLFMAERQPITDYLLIPRVSSENRKYIPIGYLTPDVIISDRATALPNASLFLFGILTSTMHMAWMRVTCGRLESRYNYSNSIVYNNYPFPQNPSEKQKETIEKAAQKVLDTRGTYPTSSLADLYDPLTMPLDLVKAHNELDIAVDHAYSQEPFTSNAKRMAFLFELYEVYTAGLFGEEHKLKSKRKK